MIPFGEVESYIGHAPGGVFPFTIKEGAVYLDASLERFATIYPAAGDDHSVVRVTPEKLFSLVKASGWVDVAKFS